MSSTPRLAGLLERLARALQAAGRRSRERLEGSNPTSEDLERVVAEEVCAALWRLGEGAEVWIAGRFAGGPWQLLGVYQTKAEAVLRCRYRQDFVGPAVIGEDCPEAIVAWPGATYPLAKLDGIPNVPG